MPDEKRVSDEELITAMKKVQETEQRRDQNALMEAITARLLEDRRRIEALERGPKVIDGGTF